MTLFEIDINTPDRITAVTECHCTNENFYLMKAAVLIVLHSKMHQCTCNE